MAETIVYFFEDQGQAAAKFSYYRTTGTPVILIGPTALLTPAGTKIEAVLDDRDYYVVIATHADAVADPPDSVALIPLGLTEATGWALADHFALL